MQYPYHMMLLDLFKEEYGIMQMNETNKDLVKCCNLWLKEQREEAMQRPGKNKKGKDATQITFNCSDALLLAPWSLFYSQLLQVNRNAENKVNPVSTHDPLLHQHPYIDPEDLMTDIMGGMLDADQKKSTALTALTSN